MDLRITALSFSHFRNYELFELDDVGNLTILIGCNAVGKTNALEGIHLLTSASSFRHPQISQLILEGEEQSHLEMQMSDGNREITTSLHLESGKRRYSVNGKPKQAADVRGLLPAVSFVPDDLELAKRSSSVRRDAIDQLGMQLTKNYYVLHRDYEKALRYKNRLLKDEAPESLLEAMNETFSTCATQLFCYRHTLFNRMIPLVEENYRSISRSNEPFAATYTPSWDHLEGVSSAEESYSKEEVASLISGSLAKQWKNERERRRSLVGPHNDQIRFYLSGRDTSDFASQGQQRSIVLAWKLAEVEMVRQTVGSNPVLLLDDVMSELDESRRNLLVEHVDGDIQTFITTTDLSPFENRLVDVAQVVKLDEQFARRQYFVMSNEK